MHIATYNVESGGFSDYKDYESTQSPRLGAIQEVVASLGADVVGLTDTFRWHQLYSPADLRAIFSYSHAATIPIKETTMDHAASDIGLTVLSNRELIRTSPVNLGERWGLKTAIELDDSSILSLFVAYLNHAQETKRVMQARALIDYATHSGSLEQTIVMGDLNTVSRSDRGAKLLGHALSLLSVIQKKGIVSEASGKLEGHAYDRLIGAGFIDANKERVATYPTRRYRLLGRVAIPSIFRVDHILHSPDIAMSQCVVPKGKEHEVASDHFPVVAKLAT